MTETNINVTMPCARGCERSPETETQAAQIMGALHGHYCDRCYYRTKGALDRAGTLVQHILSQVAGLQSKPQDGSQRLKKDPPLPMNVDAFNDANETYARLVYWSSVWATRLGLPIPTPAARAWRTDNNRIVGLPHDITPDAARYAVSVMTAWLHINLDNIFNTARIEDITYFQDEMRDIYRIGARWPQEDQAKYVAVTCWVETHGTECGARIAVHPPRFPGQEETITCENGHYFKFDEYDRMASVFREVRKKQAQEFTKAAKIAGRLNKKYGAA